MLPRGDPPPAARPNQLLSLNHISHQQQTHHWPPQTPTPTPHSGSANQQRCQHWANQLKCLMSVLYNTDMAIKEHLKRAQGYQVVGCGLWCHGLLVFKQRLVSIKAALMSTSGVSTDPTPATRWFTRPGLHKQLLQRWGQSPLIKSTFDFSCEYRCMQGK